MVHRREYANHASVYFTKMQHEKWWFAPKCKIIKKKNIFGSVKYYSVYQHIKLQNIYSFCHSRISPFLITFLKCNKILSLCRFHLMMQWNMQVMHVICPVHKCTRIIFLFSFSQITWHWSIVWYIISWLVDTLGVYICAVLCCARTSMRISLSTCENLRLNFCFFLVNKVLCIILYFI